MSARKPAAAAKAARAAKPRRAQAPVPVPETPPATTICRRCGEPAPVGEDGFCGKCEKALEQACL